MNQNDVSIVAHITGNLFTKGNSKRSLLSRARSLIDTAMTSGATTVRVDLINPDTFHSNPAVVSQLRDLVLTETEVSELMQHTHDDGMTFQCTPHSLEYVDYAVEVSTAPIRISSGDITWTPLLEKLSTLDNIDFVLGCGGSYLKEVALALGVIEGYGDEDYESDGNERVTLLHTSAPLSGVEGMNLNRIVDLQSQFFPSEVGYSDKNHMPTIAAATALYGVNYFEVPLDLKDGKGADSAISYSPMELRNFADLVYNLVAARDCGCTEIPGTDLWLRAQERRNPGTWLRPRGSAE